MEVPNSFRKGRWKYARTFEPQPKVHFSTFCQRLAINARKMARRTDQRLQERTRDSMRRAWRGHPFHFDDRGVPNVLTGALAELKGASEVCKRVSNVYKDALTVAMGFGSTHFSSTTEVCWKARNVSVFSVSIGVPNI